MTPRHTVDIMAAISYIGSGGLAIVATTMADAMPHYANHILTASAIVVALAGLLTRLLNNQTQAGTATVQDAATHEDVTVPATPTKGP